MRDCVNHGPDRPRRPGRLPKTKTGSPRRAGASNPSENKKRKQIMNTKENPTVPHWLLRRIGPRALQVLERHKSESAALQNFDKTLAPAVAHFVEVYDASRAGSPSTRQLAASQKAIDELRIVMRGWL